MKTYTESEKYWIWLSSVNGMTARRFYRLLTVSEDPESVWNEPEEYRFEIGEPLYAELIKAHTDDYIDSYFGELDRHGITALARNSALYPESLQHIKDAPPVLYVKGDIHLDGDKNFAMVGTRNTTYDGQKAACDIAGGLACNGVTVISGLARGIDTFSHKACLDAGGRTIAVLGNGLNTVYPSENAALAQRILDAGGSLVSEMRPQDSPTRWSFPQRNRIISGLSAAVLVVEGSAKSGAMITAGFALDEGKDVFAVPGSPYSPNSEGTNRLIQSGAYPVLSYWDILESMRWGSRTAKKHMPDAKAPELDENEKKLYDALKNQPLSFDELMNVTLFSASQLNSILTMLLLRGIIIKMPGNIYRRA